MPIDRRLFFYINWPLLISAIMLFALGALNLYSASGHRLEEGMSVAPFFNKQLIWGLMGVFGMILFMFFDYRHLKTLAWPVFWITVLLLVSVFFMGKTIYGAKRWLDLGFMNFQPSELAKIAILIVGARILSKEREPLDFLRLFYVLGVGLILAGLIIKQPDLGSGLSIIMILGGMILFRGVTPRVFKTALLVIPLLLPLSWFFLHDYQKQRIMTFLDPTTDPLGAGYHIIQSEIAIGSGGFWGKGFLEGTQSQLRFLPERHTDFAVAVLGEEWGFFGTMLLLSLFCFFLYQMVLIARDARGLFGSYLATGVFFYFFWQILINTGMVLGLMPVVGIPLPFISYGGSATLVNFCLVGLVLNVSMRRFLFKQR
ncbi:cell wall shape-determining protein [Pseudodesulfovibrio profundus]|uniref:Peptidoglycan glycosyltransferase RodA n=1 Tax=Pseudodesulfovibrio profundus TaxID=57320 RepID=A0A2C8F756_9BACT|nr:rod shape-determining protein RodA [Pseudodesulfovibrio profundus]MBC17833.1 rod shape-determining protein RodA [Desulfovibrio sp.]SOB58464.1 cell wall shape-determining protein [Pseudodesulfovibrio profundus]|tara:strand:+ start:17333 stop:18445 length:1113 start_codon:yes stop_codon:yes gene_type:complete